MSVLLSIIVPVYNTERYLGQCLDSLLDQSDCQGAYEIVCIDDGSTDSSARILEDYADRNACIRVIHKENGGVSAARNVGIDIAEGDYIWFVDSDDCIAPDCISHLCAAIRDYAPEMIKIGVVTVEQDYDYRRAAHRDRSMVCECLPLDHRSALSASCVDTVMKKSILTDNRLCFPEGIKYGEDTMFRNDFVLCLTKDIYRIMGPLMFYRQHADSAEHKADRQSIGKKINDYFVLMEHTQKTVVALKEKGRPVCAKSKENHIYYSAHRILSILPCSDLSITPALNRLKSLGYFPLRANKGGVKTLRSRLSIDQIRRIVFYSGRLQYAVYALIYRLFKR